MHFAPLLLLIVCEFLLYWADRYTPLPDWVHLAVTTSVAVTLLLLDAVLLRRDGRLLTGLRLKITGMQHEKAKAARRYKSLLEGAGNAIFVFNAESGVLEEVNRKGTELVGFSKEELRSMLGRDLLHPEEHDKFRTLVYQIKRHGRGGSDSLRFQKKDGSLFFGEVDGRLIDLGDEQVVHCILRDITDKKRSERKTWQRNRELSILNNILTGINVGPRLDGVPLEALVEIMELFQADGGIIHLLGTAGDPPQLCASRHVSEQRGNFIGACVAAFPHRFREVRIMGEGADDDVFSGAAADGWGCLTSVPLNGQDHHLIGVMHLMHPSPRPYSEDEIRFLETVGKQLGNVVEKNRLFAELNWKSAELLRSHHLLEKTSHKLSISEIKLKQNLAVVEQANIELSRLDRMKNHFLGMASHEFNTPLTSIISGVEHLLQQKAGGDSVEVLEMVRDGGLRLKELVADLLKLIRLEARGAELHPSAVHVKQLIESMKDQLKPQLDRRRQTVKLTALDRLPYFEGDRQYLERVFAELLLNAMKFSPEGSEIEVTGRVVEKHALWQRRETLERFNSGFLRRCGDRCYLQVEVRDPGIGIPPDEQQGIFEIFYEVGEIRHHSSGGGTTHGKGAGLGLAMVKGMVEAHGGMVWVESTQGSSFFLLLPLEQELSQPALF